MTAPSTAAPRGTGRAVPAAVVTAVHRALGRLEPELVLLRRRFHSQPELGFAEHATAAVAARRLDGLGLAVRTGVAGTGVIADLRAGRPGPRILIRAELDGVPVHEANGLPFAADTPAHAPAGHLCGHDVHLAALIGVASVLSRFREDLAGSFRFCLQPAEELLAGAAAMVADGVLDSVDRALGAHVLSGLPFGTVSANSGTVLSGADFFRLTVRGAGGHAGTPGQFADAVLAAAQVTTALQALVARETPVGDVLVVGVGSIRGGNAANAAPEEVVLLGNLRWFDPGVAHRARRRVGEIAAGVASAMGCSTSLEWTGHAPPLANDPALAAAAAAALSAEGVAAVVQAPPLTASDDFAEFSSRVPGLFLGVGCGGPDAAPHHHPRFTVDERAVALTARVLASAAVALSHPAE